MPSARSDGAQPAKAPRPLAQVVIPTPFGPFLTHAFEASTGHVYLALVRGEVDGRAAVLTRLHSECLTGDALGSLRCDCGVQLRSALRVVSAEGSGVVLYLTGQEGRGIGLVNKLRAYMEQDHGADTLDANLRLGLPADDRDYSEAAAVLAALGIRSVRLLSNNPAKRRALAAAGMPVEVTLPLATVPHHRNRRYLDAKELRFGHVRPSGATLAPAPALPLDVGDLIGTVRPRPDRPHVLVKYAQTVDGRIATATGDSRWISGSEERRVSHGLRAACDAVMVGAGTAQRDDPRLTVRMVPGASPMRVVLDSRLRTPPTAKIFSDEAATVVVTTSAADPARRGLLEASGVRVHVVGGGPSGVDVGEALQVLRDEGVESLMVEGGSAVITSLLAEGVVDRLVVSVSPKVVGAGIEAVGALGVERIGDGVQLRDGRVFLAGADVILCWDVVPPIGED